MTQMTRSRMTSPRSMGEVLAAQERRHLVRDDAGETASAVAGQEAQPVALVPRVHRKRHRLAADPAEVERDAERGLETHVLQHRQRLAAAERPRIREVAGRASQLASE